MAAGRATDPMEPCAHPDLPNRLQCLAGHSWLVWAIAIGSAIVCAAYIGSPLALIRLRRTQLRHGRCEPSKPSGKVSAAMICFVLFILFCGLGHGIETVMTWAGWAYYAYAVNVLLTATVSVGTLWFLIVYQEDLSAYMREAQADAKFRAKVTGMMADGRSFEEHQTDLKKLCDSLAKPLPRRRERP